MIAFRRLAPLPLLLIGLAVLLAVLALVPGVSQAQSRDSGGDFTLDAANGYPTGIWSDGTTMWVADFEDHKLYAYRMSDRSRDAGRDFTLDAANGSPVGIWSDGTTMWTADFTDAKLYAYRMSDRRRDSGRDFNTLFAAGNKFPEGIWSDGTTMWVADTGNDTVFAYDLSTRAWDFEKDITLAPGHGSPMGVWSNGHTMWVSDWRDAKLYAYSMSDQTWDAGKDFALDADGESYEGIWSAGSTMWVASRDDGKIYAHDWNNPPTGAPTLTGAVRVDETLTAGARSIADADGLDAAVFEYQWVSNDGNADTDIADATDSTYLVAPGDRGRTIRVRVSFTDGAGNEESLTSEPTGRVGAGGVCDRTPAVMAAIVAGMPGVGDCSEGSETRLTNWTGSQGLGADVTPGLHLHGRGLSVLQAGDFGDLHALRALNLNRNFLAAVPDGLFQDLGMVEELHLSGNLLTELPDGTFDGQTAKLSVLDLSGNRLELMPDGMLGNLAGLASLSLAGNGLARVPASLFDDLGELEKLDLSANSMDQLPDGVFDGNLELRDLDLSGNELEDLPAGVFEGLSGLTELDAGDNPGAPFTFTAELERRGNDMVVVRLAEGATPFDLKIELSARNGELSADTVTIAAGGSDSDAVEVRPHGDHPVAVEIDSVAFLLPAGGSASGIRADRGGAVLMWIGRPAVQREWIQDGPFALHPENADPKSIWSDGETLWVGDDSGQRVFAYKLWDDPGTAQSEYGTRDPGRDFPSLGEEDFYVTGHGARLYVAEESLDGASRDVFGYDLTSFTRAEDRDFVYGGLNVPGGVFIVRGAATDGRHLWITNTTSRAHAFRLYDDPETAEDEYGRPDPSRKLTVPGRGQLKGLFTDGRTMWGVRFASNDASARSVKLSDGTEAGYDFTLHEDNDHAYGIWSNGDTFYVVDADDDMIYTYHGVGGVVRASVADAETAAALVGNTEQAGAAGHDLGSTGAKRAQAFTTGNSNAGYALASVGIEFGEVSDASSAPSDLEATLNADGGGVPGDALCTLIAPASRSERSVNTFAAPASGTTCPVLEKATTYFVVVERVGVTGSGAIAIGGTASDAEDQGAAEGWSIGDGSQAYSSQAAAPGWSSDAFSHQIEVRGSFINNPAAGEAMVTGTAQVGRTLAAAVSDVSDDDGLTSATYSYRWLRVDGATETYVGTGSSSHELVAADLGKRIRVRVVFVDDRGNHETLTSAATEAVEVFRAADRPGTVSLFPARPTVGTVVSAALTDPDGPRGRAARALRRPWARFRGAGPGLTMENVWTVVEGLRRRRQLRSSRNRRGDAAQGRGVLHRRARRRQVRPSRFVRRRGRPRTGSGADGDRNRQGPVPPLGHRFHPRRDDAFHPARRRAEREADRRRRQAGRRGSRRSAGRWVRRPAGAGRGPGLLDQPAVLHAPGARRTRDAGDRVDDRRGLRRSHARRRSPGAGHADRSEPLALGRPAGFRPAGPSLDRHRRRAGGNGRAGPDVPGRQGPARRPANGRRGAGQSVRRLLAGVLLRLPQPAGAWRCARARIRCGWWSTARNTTTRSTCWRQGATTAGTRSRMTARRSSTTMPTRPAFPMTDLAKFPSARPARWSLGIPHPGDQRGRFPGWPSMGGVGRTTRGGHAEDEVAADFRVHRSGRFRESDRRSGAGRHPGPAADPGAGPRRRSVHRDLQQTRQRPDTQGERQPCCDGSANDWRHAPGGRDAGGGHLVD